MSDYTQNTDFSAKDTLPADDPEKIILGADVDEEFSRISAAIATKYDDTDLASQAEAEAGTSSTKLMTPQRVAQRQAILLASQAEAEAGSDNTKTMTPLRVAQRTTAILASQAEAEAESSNTVLMTPLRVANWADANGGMVGDLQALADPNADRLLGWDDSAGAATGFAVGTGLKTTATPGVEADVNGLTSATPVASDEVMIYDVSASGIRKATLTDVLAIAAPSTALTYKYLTADQIINTTTLTSVTSLAHTTVASNRRYIVEIFLILANITTQSIKCDVIPNDVINNERSLVAEITQSTTSGSGSIYVMPTTFSGTPNGHVLLDAVGTASNVNLVKIYGSVKTNTSDVLNVQLASNTGPTSFTVLKGSWAKYEELGTP